MVVNKYIVSIETEISIIIIMNTAQRKHTVQGNVRLEWLYRMETMLEVKPLINPRIIPSAG